jgi:hypothetical protein
VERCGGAIDARATRHEGYTISQSCRPRIEPALGWLKAIAWEPQGDWNGHCLSRTATEVTDFMRVTEALARLKGVFLEMPGARMSGADASRLTGLDQEMCLVLLKALEDATFLSRTTDGRFVRRNGDSPLR